MSRVLQFMFVCIVYLTSTSAFAADGPSPSPALQSLDKAVGKWIYHGEQLQTAYTKAGKWTWKVDCGWSGNHIYLVCSFEMDWPEGPDHSVSIATYNKIDRAYWHYEILDDYKGDKPVISRMTIVGGTWTETSDAVDINSKTAHHFRVVYRYASPTQVEVRFETSNDALHWVTVGRGQGIKQS